MLTQAGLFAHAVACFAFALLALQSTRRGAESDAPGRWLIGASALTSAWAFVYVVAAAREGLLGGLLSPLETLRTAAWAAFVVALLARSREAERDGQARRAVISLGAIVLLQLVVDAARVLIGDDAATEPLGLVFALSRMGMAIGGLLLAHNLYVNTAPSSRWSVRLLCVALGGLFGYDLNLYTVALLQGRLPADLFNIRGLGDALVVPLILLSAQRSYQWRIRLSRQVVFQSVSLVGVGGYLVLMSALGYGLRAVGGDWGRLLQIGFIFAAAMLLAVVVVSGKFRAWARVQVNKNFFAHKYDYRQEILRFIATLSGDGEGTLPERVVKAVCQLVDSPAGVLFTRGGGEDGDFAVAGRWNPLTLDVDVPADAPLARFLATQGRIVNLDDLRAGIGHGDLAAPEWTADRRLWLIVPLAHLDRLNGFIVMERSLAPRTLNWEDYDLLRTTGRQAASYIAESESQRALLEARKFDEFNRRFAFILHDIKNVVSQLSLVARNAQKHGANPEFQADMAATLNNSVSRLGDLLARLGARGGDRAERADRVDLAHLVGEVGRRMRRVHGALTLDMPTAPLWVEADGTRLEVAIEHLTQNAIDASVPDAPIALMLAKEDGHARLEITDHGQGMTPAFVRDALFEPFHSTKVNGFGIGAYEAREIVRSAHGRLSVSSRAGEGSVFTILLPLADETPHRGHA